MFKSHAAAFTVALLASSAIAHAQTVQTLRNQMPEIPVYGFLMTDGTAMVQGSNETLTLNGKNYGDPHGSFNHWYKLVPDSTGHYEDGTWTRLADSITYDANGAIVPYEPYAGSGAVMRDGRLALVGGEYTGNNVNFTLTNETSVYDPFNNKWTPIEPPLPFDGRGGFLNFGDSPTTVLPGGNLLVGQKVTKRAVALDPRFYTWVQYGGLMQEKNDFNAEEGWTLLPDGSILTADVSAAPKTERLIPAPGLAGWHWINEGDTPVILRSPPDACCIPYDHGTKIYNPPGEIGPAILRPDGTVFATGALPYHQQEAHTAIFHPGPGYTGTWTAGPDFQTGDQAGDNFGVLLRNGDVLVEGDNFYVSETADIPGVLGKRRQAEQQMKSRVSGAAAAQAEIYPSSHLYEFNGTDFTQLPVGVQAGASLLPLPTGQVLAMGYGEELFTPADNTYNTAWRPTIRSAPQTIAAGNTYEVTGTQFNGLSQACSYGDEFQCATNYPLVRIRNTATGDVVYARTHHHSTMGVATGGTLVWTYFDVPAGIGSGASTLEVVANGLASAPVPVAVQ
jgi:hypothetical protein